MFAIFVLLGLLVVYLLIRALYFRQEKNLSALDASIDARINQLKKEFQQRTIELRKRLDSGDLDEDEWKQMSYELEIDTAKSLGSMRESKQSRKQEFPLWGTGLIVLVMLSIAVISYHFTGGFDRWQQKQMVVDELMLDPNSTVAIRKAFEKKPTAESAEKLYLSARVAVDLWPNDSNKWRDLAEVNVRLQRLGDAWEAIQHARELNPDDQSVRMVQAQILAATKDPADMQSAQSILKSILVKEPDNQRVRMIYGFNAFSIEDYPTAIDAWQEVAKSEQTNSKIKTMLERSISVAKERMANKGKSVAAAGGLGKIFVSLDIPESVRTKLSGDETIFVFAKAASGPPMPLAVQKLSVNNLPKKIELSDRNAMTPQMKLSQFKSVKVIARISKSGDARKHSGDLESGIAQIDAPFNGQTVSLSFDPKVKPEVVDAQKTAKTSIKAGTDSVGLTVTVSISEKIKQSLSGHEILYVFAKAASGPPMPLAVKRIPVDQIPETIQLSDNDAMRPELKLSSFDQVNISARISKSGNAIKQAGDIQSETVTVALPHSELIRVVIE